MSDAIIEAAPAKVNLTLRVGPPRADGYHPLDSLTVFADWADAVAARPAEGLHLSLTGPGGEALQAEPQNLVLKAAYALRAAAEKPELGAALTLEKHLPIAAGLGGGSSDAAAALRALNTLWELDFSTRQLAEIGAVVGADVPACVHARALRMTGIGETITPLIAWPALDAVILHPGEAVSTAAVFAAYDETRPGPLAAAPAPAAGDLPHALAALSSSGNDLEPAAQTICPAIRDALAALAATPRARLTRMSGSGASCFAVYGDQAAAQDAAQALDRSRPGWSARAVRFGGAV